MKSCKLLNNHGHSLLEVLVSITLLTGILASSFVLFSGLSARIKNNDYNEALFLAVNEMELTIAQEEYTTSEREVEKFVVKKTSIRRDDICHLEISIWKKGKNIISLSSLRSVIDYNYEK
ncbi:MAG: hypothetical protein PHR06_15830 [Candidatus Cloacimonetes bacterium]|nr:hypothetical protein [Candidatus Cloacimonadota bacterium]